MLNTYDLIKISWIKNFWEKYIQTEKWKTIILEYLWVFEDNFLYETLNKLDFSVQIKIRKEKWCNAKKDLLKSDFIDIYKLREKEKYEILLDPKKVQSTRLEEKHFNEYITLEDWNNFIYRHYVILSIPENRDERDFSDELFRNLKNKDIIIRLLNKLDLQKYIYDEINFPYQQSDIIPKYNEKIKDTVLSNKFERIENKINNLLSNLEISFFQNDINTKKELINLFPQKCIKSNNYMQIWDNYKAWLVLAWLPKDDNFNILQYCFMWINNRLQHWDSIVINFYKEDIIDPQEKLTWIDKYTVDSKSNQKDIIYTQILINFNEISQSILDSRIHNFWKGIWEDFCYQRVSWLTSHYFSTLLGIWNNPIQIIRGYSKEKIQDNFIF